MCSFVSENQSHSKFAVPFFDHIYDCGVVGVEHLCRRIECFFTKRAAWYVDLVVGDRGGTVRVVVHWWNHVSYEIPRRLAVS